MKVHYAWKEGIQLVIACRPNIGPFSLKDEDFTFMATHTTCPACLNTTIVLGSIIVAQNQQLITAIDALSKRLEAWE
jgi:hypothetical protein